MGDRTAGRAVGRRRADPGKITRSVQPGPAAGQVVGGVPPCSGQVVGRWRAPAGSAAQRPGARCRHRW
ncbi:hypothetical protein [Actinosynnema sp. NPDC023587]|uniref:hypothetical protein n=1 Tax=Actinosynnema sp. NPDC023587 TaxID=3154695 RepID=UPI0033EE5A21